jgi:hypothetical protein
VTVTGPGIEGAVKTVLSELAVRAGTNVPPAALHVQSMVDPVEALRTPAVRLTDWLTVRIDGALMIKTSRPGDEELLHAVNDKAVTKTTPKSRRGSASKDFFSAMASSASRCSQDCPIKSSIFCIKPPGLVIVRIAEGRP